MYNCIYMYIYMSKIKVYIYMYMCVYMCDDLQLHVRSEFACAHLCVCECMEMSMLM